MAPIREISTAELARIRPEEVRPLSLKVCTLYRDFFADMSPKFSTDIVKSFRSERGFQLIMSTWGQCQYWKKEKKLPQHMLHTEVSPLISLFLDFFCLRCWVPSLTWVLHHRYYYYTMSLQRIRKSRALPMSHHISPQSTPPLSPFSPISRTITTFSFCGAVVWRLGPEI